jgi:hypothetical protein
MSAAVTIDFFPDWPENTLFEELSRRVENCGDAPLETLFLGLLHKRLMYAVMKDARLGALSRKGCALREDEVARLARLLKNWVLPVAGTLPWEHAQVTRGGVPLDEVGDDFSSLRCPGLYLAGEILDATGLCGGYNLHWAWCSGQIAGRAAAKEAEK